MKITTSHSKLNRNKIVEDSKSCMLMTWLDEIPLEQKDGVEELRKRTINDCTPKMLEDPSLFYRFLKGCNYNLKNAETMLQKHILWRKENGIDTTLTDYKCPEVFQNYFPVGRFGCNKEGYPVIYTDLGKFDINGFIKSCRKVDMLRHLIHLTEFDRSLLPEQSRKTGRLITQCIYIYNCGGLSLQSATNKLFIEVAMQHLSTFQNNYPEHVKAVYIINATKYFTILYALVKLVVTSGLLSKVHIFGTDNWKEALLETMDADVLPAFLGGKRTDSDGDPLCKNIICHGGKVPEKYFLSSNRRTMQHEDGVKKIMTTRRSNTEIVIDIADPDSVLTWEFETKNRDIRFGVSYKSPDQGDGEIVELIPKKRVDTSYEPEVGNHVCKNAGSYILVFDNSFSWIFSKEIYYRTNVIPPSTR